MLGAISCLNRTKNLEKKGKSAGENSQRSNGNGVPRFKISVPSRGRTRPELAPITHENPCTLIAMPFADSDRRGDQEKHDWPGAIGTRNRIQNHDCLE